MSIKTVIASDRRTERMTNQIHRGRGTDATISPYLRDSGFGPGGEPRPIRIRSE